MVGDLNSCTFVKCILFTVFCYAIANNPTSSRGMQTAINKTYSLDNNDNKQSNLKRTQIFIRAETSPGEYIFIRGGN